MELEQMDNALKASWQSVAQNINMVHLLLITHEPNENTHALLSRSEAMMQELMSAEAEYAPIDEQRLYIVFRGELEYLPEGYEVILENGNYLAVAVEN